MNNVNTGQVLSDVSLSINDEDNNSLDLKAFANVN